jgi:hypothetical protein
MRMSESSTTTVTLCCIWLLACSAPASTEPGWKIVPGQSAGAITRVSSERDLIAAYGADKVEGVRVELGEGETTPGTVLFGADSVRRVEIIWKDTVARAVPTRLVWRGSSSRWQLPGGLGLGSSLHELEAQNKGPFSLAGFGWDYAGVVVDWAGGALATKLPGVHLYLDPGPTDHQSPAYGQVLGDRDYSSANEHMQSLNPRIYQIFMDFE